MLALRPRARARSARKAPLCGNSIATDRGFLARDMPELDGCLHYRMVDVSLDQGAGPALVPAGLLRARRRRAAGTARSPTSWSRCEELRYYRAAIFVPQPGPTSEEARRPRTSLAGGADGRRLPGLGAAPD